MSEQAIVIPAEARRDFDINVGEKVLVLADLEKGIALVKASAVIGAMTGILEMFQSAPAVDEETEGDTE